MSTQSAIDYARDLIRELEDKDGMFDATADCDECTFVQVSSVIFSREAVNLVENRIAKIIADSQSHKTQIACIQYLDKLPLVRPRHGATGKIWERAMEIRAERDEATRAREKAGMIA